MEHESIAAAGTLAATSKRVGRRLLGTLENRLELLAVEVQEERERLLKVFMLALGVAVFGLLAGLSLTAAIVFLFWPHSPLAVLLVLTAVYAVAGFQAWRLLSQRLDAWQPFPTSLDQLRKDRLCLDQILS